MTAVYLGRLGDALTDGAAAVRLASLTRNRRDECLARNVLAIGAYQAGDAQGAERESDEGLAIARDVGLRRFEADHLSMRGAARAALGRRKAGKADLEAAWELVRDRDIAYAGPWVLGFLAQIESDPLRRRDCLERGEAALADNSLSHNHFQFRQCALEIALEAGDGAALEHHAAALARYTADEPLPWSELQIAAARALLDWKEGRSDDALRQRLRALDVEARAAGLTALAERLGNALRSVPDSER
jgi:hypothetical protein